MNNTIQSNIDVKTLLRQNKLVLLYFFTDLCSFCSLLTPVLDKVSNIRKDIVIVKINGDSNADLLSEYQIYAFPTLVLCFEGKKIKKHLGYCSEKELLLFLQ